MEDTESVTTRVSIFISHDSIAFDIDIALNFRLLCDSSQEVISNTGLENNPDQNLRTHRLTLQVVQVWALEYEIPDLPCIIVLALLPHPSFSIRRANLLQNTRHTLELHWLVTIQTGSISHIRGSGRELCWTCGRGRVGSQW